MKRAAPDEKTDYSKYRTEKEEVNSKSSSTPKSEPNQAPERKLEPIRVEKKVGRNDPCPCGSGKKFKNCHGE